MKWSTTKPNEPGFYWLAEASERPHVVEVSIESDSRGMFFVTLPGDNEKYPIDVWDGALWCGPLVSPE